MARYGRAWLLCAVVQWRVATAWSPASHERIARIALSILKEKQVAQIQKMLGGDLVSLSTWEKEMTEKHPATDILHWHRQSPEWTCEATPSINAAQTEIQKRNASGQIFMNVSNVFSSLSTVLRALGGNDKHIQCDDKTAEEGSLYCALAYFFYHFAHDALLKEYSPPYRPINVPEKLPTLEKLQSVELTPKHYLRWLVILIGDLHQPLHWLREHDYGREVKVIYKGEKYTLLNFFEEIVPKKLPAKLRTEELKGVYARKRPQMLARTPPELFRDWAKEVAGALCTRVYAPMEVTHANGTMKIDKIDGFEVSDDTFNKWLKIIEDNIDSAGVRLAYVLTDILEHRRHKIYHKEGRVRAHMRGWKKHWKKNLIIAVILVPSILGLLTVHERSGGLSITDLIRANVKRDKT
eukprot:gnl/TRDRNA2_/TRDRNA2_171564_c0_seq1.p1 gnl/TRDRNA2_/TRDRNA2_171564_c0~~gnl/TRDRNA2_/TRDRNA2_171564_c0_seq1.p1  ORF type:complete len:409 (+),score=89.56 gnl/TRDRNA2_/TRDRNA2_171564_c0_seq1:40-1266(+)